MLFLFVIDDNDINIVNTKAEIKDDDAKPAEATQEVQETPAEEQKHEEAQKTEEKT